MDYTQIEQDCQTVQTYFTGNQDSEVPAVVEAASRIAQACHTASASGGWWSEEALADQDLYWKKVALIHSEIAEATEGARKGIQDDKLPQFTMFEAELADTIIRVCDLLGRMATLIVPQDEVNDGNYVGYAYVMHAPPRLVGKATGQPGMDLSRLHLHTATILDIAHTLRDETGAHEKYKDREILKALCTLLMACFETAQVYDLDIGNVIATKMQFNAQRADHKPENRKKAGGKKW